MPVLRRLGGGILTRFERNRKSKPATNLLMIVGNLKVAHLSCTCGGICKLPMTSRKDPSEIPKTSAIDLRLFGWKISPGPSTVRPSVATLADVDVAYEPVERVSLSARRTRLAPRARVSTAGLRTSTKTTASFRGFGGVLCAPNLPT